MNYASLFLFERNTDATSSEQGFYYQKLKTLEIWLYNRVNDIQEDIYCDYGDDILSRPKDGSQSFYHQVKLYSSNFSFSTEEITKCVTNFFFLFIRQVDQQQTAKFVFETNASVAREVKSNDANLLREWAKDQGNLSREQIDKFKVKIQSVLTLHINEQSKNTYQPGDPRQKAIIKAQESFNSLSEDIWEQFILSISWDFESIPKDTAIDNIINRIEKLVNEIPLPLKGEYTSAYIAILLYEITHRTAQQSTENRKLDGDLMDFLLLNSSSEQNRWYASVFEKWQAITSITAFNMGKFYEVISAARHCRWHLDKSQHSRLWLDVLSKYIELENIPANCKKKAIYEFLWLRILPDPDSGAPRGNLIHETSLIETYFGTFDKNHSIEEVNDDITLLNLVQVTELSKKDFLPAKTTDRWLKQISDYIEEGIAESRDKDDLCRFLELKGHLVHQLNPKIALKERVNQSLDIYRKIIPNLDAASLYTISSLNDQLNQMIRMMIKHKGDRESIKMIESFQEEVLKFTNNVENQYKTAKNYVERAQDFISTGDPRDNLEALNYLHKSSQLWYTQDSKDAYISVMITISGIYLRLKMNFAAKYYALCAVFASKNFGDAKSYRRISDAAAMLVSIDYRQGAWMSALNDVNVYIISRIEFNPMEMEVDKDSFLADFIHNLASILTIMPRIHVEMTHFANYFAQTLGWLYTDYISHVGKGLQRHLESDENLKSYLKLQVSDVPLNDVGKVRTLRFSANEIDWEIIFENTPDMNATGEQFASALQVILCEFMLSGIDCEFLELSVKIFISRNAGERIIIRQKNDHINTAYEISIPKLTSQVEFAIKMHYAYLGVTIKRILNDLSLLPTGKLPDIFDQLLMKHGLGNRVLSINSYEKVYFGVHYKEAFEQSRPGDFNTVPDKDSYAPYFVRPIKKQLGQSNNMEIITNAIIRRQKALLKNIHLSLQNWKNASNYKKTIDGLRTEGWLDWQIMSAMADFLLTEKAQQLVSEKSFTTMYERRDAHRAFYNELQALDESDCYMEKPLSVLDSQEFKETLTRVATNNLELYDLACQMDFPNFNAIKTFLIEKYSFNDVDLGEISPFN